MSKLCCEQCGEEIEYYVYTLEIGIYKIEFCTIECLWEYIQNHTRTEDIEDAKNKWS